jgi:chromatin segregation and condensation protein Rec8/ScpA/Scc1 (kleisin family)
VTNPVLRDPGSGGFVVELDTFSGPLDLLLHLIREDEVDITDLPIAKIADQFLAVINELGLNQAADYLEMAARLLRIKAQLLLPRVIALIPEPMLHRVVPRPLDVEGATAKIIALLAEREQFGWADIVGKSATIVDILSAFIALLELAKRSTLTVSQPEPFGPMVITRAIPREAA